MKSILIAEGDDDVARLFATVFRRNNWDVLSLDDAAKAANVLSGDQPLDAILLSYHLRGTDGIQLTQFIRSLEHRRETPIVMVTGKAGMDLAALRAGANEVLNKPVNIYILVDVVAKHVARARHQNVSR